MRSPVFSAAAAALLLAAMLAACNKDPPPKPIQDEPKKTTPVPTDMVLNDFLPSQGEAQGLAVRVDGGVLEAGAAAEGAAAAEDDKLRVLEPGEEPRSSRKYAFAQGKVAKRVMTVKQSMGREGEPAQEITLAMTLEFVPKQVKPTGTKFEAKLLKVDLPGPEGPAKAQITQQLAAFNGLTGAFEVSPRGEVGEVQFAADERMMSPIAETIVQSLQQGLELVLPPLPEAPIGQGAKWQRKVERKERGATQQATHTFTLKELNPEGGTVTADIALAIPKHPFQARGVPPGATEEVEGKGAYTYAFRFDHVSPKVDGELTITRRIEVTDERGEKQKLVEVIKLKQELATPGK